jgi:hypothetical protein
VVFIVGGATYVEHAQLQQYAKVHRVCVRVCVCLFVSVSN